MPGSSSRGSVHIWVKNRVMDDTSSVSSLSTAFALDASSVSLQETSDPSLVRFDLTLLDGDDEDNDNSSQHQHQNDTPNPSSSEWRWNSDSALPPHRDKTTTTATTKNNVDTPINIPLRRWSSKSSNKLMLLRNDSKKSKTLSTGNSTLTSLFQVPRMPRRQLSHNSATSTFSNHSQERDSNDTADTTRPDPPSTKSPLFSERLRRFPVDLPKRKLPTSRRIRRLTRPSRTPMRRNSSVKSGTNDS